MRALGSLLRASALGSLLASSHASAQASAPPPNQKPPPASVKPEDARQYAEPPGTEPEDVALFVPRLVLSIPRYALKAVFFPVREGVRFLDRHAVIEEVTDFLYNDARTAAIVPTFGIDSYFGPSLGLKAFHEDLGGGDEYGSVEARFGGVYQVATQLHFEAADVASSPLWVESVARYENEPALLFQGIGNGSAESGTGLAPRTGAVETRYSEERLLALTRAGYSFGKPGELLRIGASGIYNVRDFGPRHRGDDPSIEQVYDTSAIVGFADRVATLEADLNLVVDVRDVAGATSSGGYLELFGGRVPKLGDYGFWHHGVELTGYVNLFRRTRVLILRAMLEAVEGKDAEIPFSDLPRLGGPHRLRGYPLDRFRDEKAAVGTIEYHYPIHQYVSGALFVDAGRVEKSYGDFFDADWHAGAGGGFIVRSQDRQLFSFDIAYGDGVQFHLTTDPLRAFSKRDTEL
jgi:hypothetical protein